MSFFLMSLVSLFIVNYNAENQNKKKSNLYELDAEPTLTDIN